MGYFSEMAIDRNYFRDDHSYPDPAIMLREDIENLKNWLRWYGCDLVDNDDFEIICNGYISEERINEYIPSGKIQCQADALRELGWLYYRLKLLEEDYKVDAVECRPETPEIDPMQITIFDYLGQINDKKESTGRTLELSEPYLTCKRLPILDYPRKVA